LYKIAVLISGSGSNLQAIIDNIEKEKLNCSIECVISDRPDVYGIKRAEEKDIKSYILDKNRFIRYHFRNCR
jgi:phosphoribosylglycinamide formyltransferase-1